MPNTEKVQKVEVLAERIRGADALLLAEYRGLTVHDATELRRSLAGQARFAVAKNTLFQRAAGDAGVEGIDALLKGPTAVAFVEGDVVAAAKKLVEAAKRFPALVLKGGYLDGRVLTGDEARALADLESREVMLSKIAGMLQSEMSRAANMFQALQGRFVGLLEALRDKTPAEADAAPIEGTETAEVEAAAVGQPEPQSPPVADSEPEGEAQPQPLGGTDAETVGETETTVDASAEDRQDEPQGEE